MEKFLSFTSPGLGFLTQFTTRLSLRTIFIVPFVLQVVALGALIGYFSYIHGQKAINEVAMELRHEISVRVQQKLLSYLEVPHLINRLNADAVRAGDLDLNDQFGLIRHFYQQMQQFENISYVYYGNEEGGLACVGIDDKDRWIVESTDNFTQGVLRDFAADSHGNPKELLEIVSRNYDTRPRPWYKAAVASGKPTWSPIYTFIAGLTTGIAAVHPVYDDTGTLQGVLTADFSLSHVNNFLQTLKVGKTGQTFIMERSGLLVASSTQEKPFLPRQPGNPELQRMKASQSGIPMIRQAAIHLGNDVDDFSSIQSIRQDMFTINGERHLLQITPLQDKFGIDWLIAVVIPEADFMEHIHQNTLNTILLCLAALLIAILVGISTTRWVTRPILQLNNAAKALAYGEWTQTIDIKRQDELGELAEAFISMSEQLRELFTSLEQKVTDRTWELAAEKEMLAQANAELNQFKVTLDASPDTVTICDARTLKFSYVNQSATKNLGYSREELLQMMPPDYNKMVTAEVIHERIVKPLMNQEQTSMIFESAHQHKSGRVFPVEVTVQYLSTADEHGKLVAIARDISERKQAEEAIAIFKRFADTAGQGFGMATLDGKITYANLALQRILGESAYGELVHKYYPPELHPRLREEALPTVLEKGQWFGELALWSFPENKVTPTSQNIFLIRDAENKPLYIGNIITDITERKQAEARLLEARDAAEAANRSKSAFLANMSHELRTPLNGILGYAQILQRDRSISGKQLDGINIIYRSGEYLLTLINDVLDLSKIEAGKIEIFLAPFNFHEFLQGVTDLFTMRARQKSIEFVFEVIAADDMIVMPSHSDLYGNLPAGVNGDEKRLRQVLINLLGNAVKFTKQGGVALKVGYRDGKMRFQVEDTGTGIAEEDLDKIFIPFQQVGDNSYKAEGTGLGLPITKRLIEMMGGELHVESILGRGSAFWTEIDLPVVPDFVKKTKQTVPLAIGYRNTRGSPFVILTLDDKWENLLVMSNLLTPLGFEVVEAANGLEGLAKLREIQPDLIITDLVMPGMNGVEFVRQVRTQPAFINTPIITASASAFDYHQQESLMAGCNAFISKPFRFEALLELLQKYLQLEWVYEQEAETTEEVSVATEAEVFVGPSPKQAVKLFDLAMKGDIGEIVQQVNQLERDDKQLAPFARKIRELAKNFEEEAICELLERYIDENAVDDLNKNRAG